MRTRGQQIRDQRAQSGYGLRAFADRIGISAGWLSRIERNQGDPSPDVVKRIALALHDDEQTRQAIAAITETENEGSDERDSGG